MNTRSGDGKGQRKTKSNRSTLQRDKVQWGDVVVFKKNRWEVRRIKNWATNVGHFTYHYCKGEEGPSVVKFCTDDKTRVKRPYCWRCNCKIPKQVDAFILWVEM